LVVAVVPVLGVTPVDLLDACANAAQGKASADAIMSREKRVMIKSPRLFANARDVHRQGRAIPGSWRWRLSVISQSACLPGATQIK
jgi:hypothetical protein